jgi:hypothetical protein
MVSHAEMGLAPGTPPISRFTFYSYLISFPLLHETGSCPFLRFFTDNQMTSPGHGTYGLGVARANQQQWASAILFSFFPFISL